MKKSLLFALIIMAVNSFSQNRDVKFFLNKDSTNYLQFNGLGQVWLRYSQLNPGSTVFDDPKDQIFDIGLRRWRFVIHGKLTKKTYFYTQFGQNNFNFRSPKYVGSFFHDAFAEYHFIEKKFEMGAGLSGWNGISRYASPSIGTLMALDAPLYQQITNGINDQFLRKLSIHAKGLIGKFNYRVALTNPMMVQTTSGYDTNLYTNKTSYSLKVPRPQFQGYFIWHFKDTEYGINPYTKGTYHGEKDILNIGVGFLQQQDALWMETSSGDTLYHQLLAIGADIFLDKPIKENQALTAYAAFHYFDFGQNYIRNVGVMNPANGTINGDILNGSGNAYPMIGTGNSYYAQVGYLFKNLGNNNTGIQPYLTGHLADYQGLDELMFTYQVGVNYLINGHKGKVSLDLQNRPVYTIATDGSNSVSERMNMLVLQYQLAF